MDTQRQDHSRKKPLFRRVRRPDTVWGNIVPPVRLDEGSLNHTIGARSAYFQTNHAEELKRTHEEQARQEFTATAPAHHYVSLAEQFRRIQPVENDKDDDEGRLSEDKVLVSYPVLQEEENNEQPFGGSDDTDDSDWNEEHDNDDSETASDTSGPATRKLQPSHGTPRRAITRVRGSLTKLKGPSRTTASQRKTAPSQPSGANGKGPRKRKRHATEESEEDLDEDDGEEEALKVPHIAKHMTKIWAQRQRLSTSTGPAPLVRSQQRWTKEEEEILFSLRNQGKGWKFISERVLGRTETGVRSHWDCMRTKSLKPVEMRTKGLKNSSVISAMAKIPLKGKRWSKEEEEILISLRSQGKTLRYVSSQLPGREYSACKWRWRMLKNRYPQIVTAFKDPNADEERGPTNCQDANSPTANQLDREADWDSQSTTADGDYPISITSGYSNIEADMDTSPPKQPYQKAAAVVVHGSFVPAVASKRTEYKAASTEYHNQQAANSITDGEDSSTDSYVSAKSNLPDLQSLAASRRDLERQKESSSGKDLLFRGLSFLRKESETRKLGPHRRSNSWS